MNNNEEFGFGALIGFLAVTVYGWPVLAVILVLWGAFTLLSFIIKLSWWIISMPFKVIALTFRWINS